MRLTRTIGTLLACLLLDACTAISPFPSAARPGDTVALPVGWNAELSRQTASVTITPTAGSPITYAGNDPRIRAVVRLYPDPVSRLVVGTETGQGLGTSANTHGGALLDQVTAGDKDWWLTVVILDLPPGLAPGPASLAISGPNGPLAPQPVILEVLPEPGQAASLAGAGIDPKAAGEMLAALERAEHATVVFAGEVVPQSVQLELTHTPQVGTPWLVNPRGDLKNLSWSDDGTTLKVILTASHAQALRRPSDLKFYIAGGLAELQVKSLKAYDAVGRPLAGLQVAIE